jgi:hypothetical protein
MVIPPLKGQEGMLQQCHWCQRGSIVQRTAQNALSTYNTGDRLLWVFALEKEMIAFEMRMIAFEMELLILGMEVIESGMGLLMFGMEVIVFGKELLAFGITMPAFEKAMFAFEMMTAFGTKVIVLGTE